MQQPRQLSSKDKGQVCGCTVGPFLVSFVADDLLDWDA